MVGLMLKLRKLLTWVGLLYMAALSHSPSLAKGIEFPEMVRKITPSIVAIATYSPLRSPRVVIRGTGFVVYDGLHIITNAHVLPRDMDMSHNEKNKYTHWPWAKP